MDKLKSSFEMGDVIDRKAFILGMITAFSECVTRECKKAAFSPPFYPHDYSSIIDETERIIDEQGLYCWYEENLDIPEKSRVSWFVIYKYPEVLEEYKRIRDNGFNPAYEFDEFKEFLSYGIVYGENNELVKPKMRKEDDTVDSVARILFQPGEWPPSRA